MQKTVEHGLRCPYTDEVFTLPGRHGTHSDSALVGLGQPARSPACPVGAGKGVAMQHVLIEVSRDGDVVSCKPATDGQVKAYRKAATAVLVMNDSSQ